MNKKIKRLNLYVKGFGFSYLFKRLLIRLKINKMPLSDLNYIYWYKKKNYGENDLVIEAKKIFSQNEKIKLVYSDEDYFDPEKNIHFSPFFKPDFSPEFLKSFNYIGDSFVVRSGIKDLDFSHLTEDEVYHIPEVLYSKKGRYEEKDNYMELLTPTEANEPVITGSRLVSILIPNKDHIEELDSLLSSLFYNNDHKNIEIIIIENNSEEEETFSYYERLLKENDPSLIKIVYYEGGFNYSKINNFGARYASGDFLLFLNNDTEIKNRSSIRHLLSDVMRDDVGASGALLLYPDDTIQHAGITIGINGFAANMLPGISPNDKKYFPYSNCRREMSACTAACLMVERDAFNKVNGFSEDLAVSLNDVDLCMKIRCLGKKIIFNPNAILYHYESKSRGLDNTGENEKRFNKEIRLFKEKWKDELSSGDPYYNKNLTQTLQDYSLDAVREVS